MSNHRRIWVVALLAIAAAACRVSDKADETGGTQTIVESPPVVTGIDCPYRPEIGSPAYDWIEETSAEIAFDLVRYRFPTSGGSPPDAHGLVVLFDGGGGSGLWFNSTEGRLMVEQLVSADYAVLAPDSSVNWDDDQNAQQNVDQLEIAVQAMRDISGNPDLPLYYVGFSKGGGFASYAHNQVPARAQVLFNTVGEEGAFQDDPNQVDYAPPTMWILGSNDSSIRPRKLALLPDFQSVLDQRLVEHVTLENPEVSPSDLAFARIATVDGIKITEGDWIEIFDEMLVQGIIEVSTDDGCPYFAAGAEQLDFSGFLSPASIIEPDVMLEVDRQIDEIYGEHQISSEFTNDILCFFETFAIC